MAHRLALFLAVAIPVIAPLCWSFVDGSSANGDRTSTTSRAGVQTLPAPTGPFAVGRVTVHWTDRSRIEPLASDRGPRELMVDVWYPAESAQGTLADYFNRSAFTQPESATRLQGYLRSAYDAVKEGLVRTHAVEGAPFARSAGRSPVLVFSHGGGEAREAYAAQLQDLASHGYTVAAITHTYESVLAMFPDGRRVVLASERWPQPAASAIEGLPPSEEANPDRLRWWADDIRFVLTSLTREQTRPGGSPAAPFAGHLDLSRAGAFGHSAGGQAAAHACQIDPRLRACLNQDGLSAFAPYYLDARGWGMDQAFMLMERKANATPPSAQQLAAMNLTVAQAETLVAKLKARQQAALRQTGRGSYHVVIVSQTTSHADFTDLPLLQSRDAGEAARHARVLDTVRRYTRAFFDQELRGVKAPLLERKTPGEFVEAVHRFPPSRRP